MKKRAFLVVWWLRVHFEMQGTPVRSLVWEDPNVPQGNQALAPQLLKPKRLEPVLRNKSSHCNEKPAPQ